jgi:carbohydrate-selective porin OprB
MMAALALALPASWAVTGAKRSGNYLLYFMANQAVYRQDLGNNRGLDVDFAADWSPDDVNQVNEQITEGFRYNGPIPRRAKDSVQSLPLLGAERHSK